MVDTKSQPDPSVSRELADARKVVVALNEHFDHVDLIAGNHEGRLLRALNSAIFPTDLLRLLDAQKWRVAPYYLSYVISGGQTFRVTHPKGSSESTAKRLAGRYQSHILMAHSHLWRMGMDASGKWFTVTMGHCVDESRLAYVGQRDAPHDAHSLGAVIVRNGFPYLLGERTPWKEYAKMK